jgi:hypothetical protein
MAIVDIKTGKVVKPTKYIIHILMNDGCGGVVLDETTKKTISAYGIGDLQLKVSSYVGTDINLRDIVPGFWEVINSFGFKCATVAQKGV